MSFRKMCAALAAITMIATVGAFAAPVKVTWWHIGTAPSDKNFYQA